MRIPVVRQGALKDLSKVRALGLLARRADDRDDLDHVTNLRRLAEALAEAVTCWTFSAVTTLVDAESQKNISGPSDQSAIS